MHIYPGASNFSLYLPSREWAGRFDSYGVEVARGQGLVEPVTVGAEYAPASIRVPALARYDVVGKTLELKVAGVHSVSVLFSSSDAFDVMAAIASAAPDLVTVYMGGTDYRIRTVAVGAGASLQLVGGDALPALYHDTTPPMRIFYGTDPHYTLEANVDMYSFTDPFRTDADTYHFYYYSTPYGTSSARSPGVSGKTAYRRDRSQLILGEIELLDMPGRAVRGVEVALFVDGSPGQVQVVPETYREVTDDSGRATFLLLRGLECTLSIGGTGVMRRIRVPAEGETFNLLDPSISAGPDNFEVQVPRILVGARRSF